VALPVGNWDDALIQAVLTPQFRQLLLQAEAIVPVGEPANTPASHRRSAPKLGSSSPAPQPTNTSVLVEASALRIASAWALPSTSS
jgi:hypothetical protein